MGTLGSAASHGRHHAGYFRLVDRLVDDKHPGQSEQPPPKFGGTQEGSEQANELFVCLACKNMASVGDHGSGHQHENPGQKKMSVLHFAFSGRFPP